MRLLLRRSLFAVTALAAGLLVSGVSAQELPLAPLRGDGQGVWPAFEGWYENGDGTRTIYFGYHNRNAEEPVEIPLGENNFIEPAEFDGNQPTHFEPRRDWGVFGIRVPADYPQENRVYWTLVVDGRTYRVPGHLHPDWKTDALGGGASAALPPKLTIGGAEGAGPMGVTGARTLSTRVGQALELSVRASRQGAPGGGLAELLGVLGNAFPDAVPSGQPDGADASSAPGGRGGAALDAGGGAAGGFAGFPGMGGGIQLTWFKHQGPGDVAFSNPAASVAEDGGEATTMARFSAPGDYVVRVRATEAPMEMAGHAQCCWTNGYVNVTVTR